MAGEPFGSFMTGRCLDERLVAADGARYCSLAMSLAATPSMRSLPAFEPGATKLARVIEELGCSFNRRESAA
jgi:hypothetical protein